MFANPSPRQKSFPHTRIYSFSYKIRKYGHWQKLLHFAFEANTFSVRKVSTKPRHGPRRPFCSLLQRGSLVPHHFHVTCSHLSKRSSHLCLGICLQLRQNDAPLHIYLHSEREGKMLSSLHTVRWVLPGHKWLVYTNHSRRLNVGGGSEPASDLSKAQEY